MTDQPRPWQRTYPSLERPYLVALFVVGIVGTTTTMIGFVPLVLLEFLMVLGAFVIVPRFLRIVVSGLVGGVITGILVLGVALRIAMRIVVLSDPVREPVLTDETVFILFFMGFIGLAFGPVVAIAQRLWNPKPWKVGALLAGLGIAAFLASPEFRTELFNEGAGALVNIPLFTVVFFLFGASVTATVRWIETKLPHTPGRQIEANQTMVTV